MKKVDTPSIQQPVFIAKVKKQIQEKNTILCIELYPNWEKMPQDIKTMYSDPNLTEIPEEIKIHVDPVNQLRKQQVAMLDFLTKIVDLTAPYTCCYTLQEAYYKKFSTLMIDIIRYIQEKYSGIPIISDCKVCNFENSNVDYYFNMLQVDAMTVVPYMGKDVVQPFINDSSKTGIVMVQPSNPTTVTIQRFCVGTIESGMVPLWTILLHLTIQWNTNNNLIAVISGNTSSDTCGGIRKIVGNNFFILVPDIDAQKAESHNFLPYLKNSENNGVLVVAADSILYRYKTTDSDWMNQVTTAACLLKNELNTARGSN
jgi:orotidine-5'-phosphate decarboxylase